MSDDLVERLYDRRVCSPAQNSCRNDWMLDQAADRIKELELAVRYEADLAQQALDAREELEANLAKAVEKLEDMQKVSRSDASHGILMVMIKHTLAELKGQDDE